MFDGIDDNINTFENINNHHQMGSINSFNNLDKFFMDCPSDLDEDYSWEKDYKENERKVTYILYSLTFFSIKKMKSSSSAPFQEKK